MLEINRLIKEKEWTQFGQRKLLLYSGILNRAHWYFLLPHKFHTKTDQNTNRTQIYIKSRSNGILLWGLPCAVTNFDFDTEVNTNTYGNKRTSWFCFFNYLEDFYLHVLSGSVIKWKQNDKKCVNLNVFRLVMHTFWLIHTKMVSGAIVVIRIMCGLVAFTHANKIKELKTRTYQTYASGSLLNLTPASRSLTLQSWGL